MNKKTEIGRVTDIFPEKGFGFIISECHTDNIYFKLTDVAESINKNDSVSFVIKKSAKGITAKFVSKIYVNRHGIKFIPRSNQTHIHLELDRFLPMIYDFVEDYNCDFIEKEFTFDYNIGTSDCFKTTDSDSVIYAIRKGRNGFSRFILGKTPQQTNSIFIVLKKIEIAYLIITVYLGKKSARGPFDPLATAEDLKFWLSNALIFDPSSIITESIITECPWDLNALCIDA